MVGVAEVARLPVAASSGARALEHNALKISRISKVSGATYISDVVFCATKIFIPYPSHPLIALEQENPEKDPGTHHVLYF